MRYQVGRRKDIKVSVTRFFYYLVSARCIAGRREKRADRTIVTRSRPASGRRAEASQPAGLERATFDEQWAHLTAAAKSPSPKIGSRARFSLAGFLFSLRVSHSSPDDPGPRCATHFRFACPTSAACGETFSKSTRCARRVLRDERDEQALHCERWENSVLPPNLNASTFTR